MFGFSGFVYLKDSGTLGHWGHPPLCHWVRTHWFNYTRHCVMTNNLSLNVDRTLLCCLFSFQPLWTQITRGKKKRGEKTVPLRTESNPWTRNILTKYSPLKSLWTFCLVMALNNIFKQTAISENTRILIITCYWVYFLPGWRAESASSASFVRTLPAFSNPGPPFRIINYQGIFYTQMLLGVSSWPLGNSKDLLPSFTNAPNEGTFCTLRILLISQTVEYERSMKFLT